MIELLSFFACTNVEDLRCLSRMDVFCDCSASFPLSNVDDTAERSKLDNPENDDFESYNNI